MYLQNCKYNVQRVCIFHLILVWSIILILSAKNREGGGRGAGGLLNNRKNPLSLTKFFLTLNDIELPKLDWKPGGKNYLTTASWFDFISFYLNHRYTHISKQILEYIFFLNKYMESWDAVLMDDYDNFAAVNNLTINFCAKLTKIWFSIIMIQAITHMTYWFTVANTQRRKLFDQSCTNAGRPCSRFWKFIAWSWNLWHGCTKLRNLEIEPKCLTKSDVQLIPDISRTKNDKRVL